MTAGRNLQESWKLHTVLKGTYTRAIAQDLIFFFFGEVSDLRDKIYTKYKGNRPGLIVVSDHGFAVQTAGVVNHECDVH